MYRGRREVVLAAVRPSARRLLAVLCDLSGVKINQAARPVPLARWIPLPRSPAQKPPAKV